MLDYEAMMKRNCFDSEIVNQPEIEYRKAKPPFVMKHRTEDDETFYTTHCPVCFWGGKYGVWDCMVDAYTLFCRRCGQKIDWSGGDGKEAETDTVH